MVMCKCTSFHSPLPPGEGTGKGGFCPAQDLRGLGLQIIAPPSSFAPGRICRGSSLMLVMFGSAFEFVIDSPRILPSPPGGRAGEGGEVTAREPHALLQPQPAQILRGSRRPCMNSREGNDGARGNDGDRNPPSPLFLKEGIAFSPLRAERGRG